MARAPNQFYGGGYPTDPTFAAIGENLGRALFGDPQMAAEQARGRAQIGAYEAQAEQNRAQARKYEAETAGIGQKNGFRGGLPELFARFAGSFQPTPAPLPEAPPRIDGGALGQILAAAAGLQDGQNIDQMLGVLPAMLGTDEQARRGLVGRGVTPGAGFALTPERADAITAADAKAKLDQALGVANIGAQADIVQSGIAADASRFGSRQSADATVESARIREAGDDRRDRVKPLSVAGRIYDQRTGRWLTPPPNFTPPMVVRTNTARDKDGNEIWREQRTFQGVSPPRVGAPAPAKPKQLPVPPGMKQVGTLKGAPVYEDARGNRFVG